MRKADYPGGFMMPHNLPVPPVLVDEGSQVTFTFNEDWLAYVIGALKALTRPEAWNADGDALDNVLREAEQLLTMWDIPSGGATPPINWAIAASVARAGIWRFSTLPDSGFKDDNLYAYGEFNPDITGFLDFKLRGYVPGSFGLTVGGLWSRIAIQTIPPGAVGVASIFIEDCGGVITTDTQILPISISNLTAKSIRITSTGPVDCVIVTAGNWTCGPA